MIDRRTFLSAAAAAAASLRTTRAQIRRAARLPIAFSTLGCPKWDWLTILDAAARHNFAALELRGLQGTMDLPTRPEFSPARVEQSKRELAARGLRVVCLGSSARMHEMERDKREAQLDEGRRFIDLAQKLGAPYVRVFGDKYVEGVPRAAMIEHVAAGLRLLGDYARPRRVTVLIESHGDFTDSPTLLSILRQADSPAVALLWDAHHTFAFSHEDPEDTARQLMPWVRHTHLKDSRPPTAPNPRPQDRRYVLTGEGEVPVRRQFAALARHGYRGYYSFEWEKRWHPEIEEPEVAIPHFARVAREYLAAASSRPPQER